MRVVGYLVASLFLVFVSVSSPSPVISLRAAFALFGRLMNSLREARINRSSCDGVRTIHLNAIFAPSGNDNKASRPLSSADRS